MATITINIPDAVTPRVLNAFATEYGWTPQVADANDNLIPNPVTKAQFAKQQVVNYIKSVVRKVETDEAVGTARVAASDAVDTQINLT